MSFQDKCVHCDHYHAGDKCCFCEKEHTHLKKTPEQHRKEVEEILTDG